MPEMTIVWHEVCATSEIAEEDLRRFDVDGKIYAIYRTPSGFHASDGLCTHEEELLTDGFVLDEIIECPKHQGRFHIPTGKAQGAPVCVNLQTYPTKVEQGQVFLGLPAKD